jgi:hypothetical protein
MSASSQGCLFSSKRSEPIPFSPKKQSVSGSIHLDEEREHVLSVPSSDKSLNRFHNQESIAVKRQLALELLFLSVKGRTKA